MRWRVPWSEIGTLGALYVALAAWSARGRTVDAAGLVCLAIGMLAALAPRAIVRRASARGPLDSWLLLVGGAAAIAAGAAIAGEPSGGVLRGVRLVAGGLANGAALVVVLEVGGSSRSQARTRLAALAIAAAAVAGGVTGERWIPGASLAPRGVMVVLAVVALARRGATAAPGVRAALALPGAGAVLASALWALAAVARHGASLEDGWQVADAAGWLAISVGLAAGARGSWGPRADAIARGVLGAAAGIGGGIAAAMAGAPGIVAGAVGAVGTAVLLPTAASLEHPDRRRLGRACVRANEGVAGRERVDELAAALLEPLRAAARDLRAPASLWVLATETRYGLDVAGAPTTARFGTQADRALLVWLRARPGEVVFADALRPLQVRRAELRPVLGALEAHEAWAAVPTVDQGELNGVVLVPRGRRAAAPSLQEAQELLALGRRIGGGLVLALALERAADRARAAESTTHEAQAARSRAELERDEALARADALRAVRVVGSLEEAWVGYSDAMRALEAHSRALAAGSAPIALVAERGAGVAAVARMIHDASPQSKHAFFVLDASQVHPRDALSALVGEAREVEREGDIATRGPAPGWLELAGEGTLVIEEISALGVDALSALAEALRTRQARRVGGEGSFVVRARVVVTVRAPFTESGVPLALAEHFAETTVQVPPLRERAGDLETLVLFGLDRACRIAGRPVVGIARTAMEALRAYAFPGNVTELYLVLEDAVRRVRGEQVALDDLPPYVRLAERSSLDGAPSRSTAAAGAGDLPETYEGLERRILESALERAGGNKSVAARALGLARTTFLDKLRKHGLRA